MENPIKETVKNIITLSMIQGIIFLILGILIAINPKILLYFVVAAFIITGISCLFYSFKIKSYYRRAEKFWKKLAVEI